MNGMMLAAIAANEGMFKKKSGKPKKSLLASAYGTPKKKAKPKAKAKTKAAGSRPASKSTSMK